jgi:hypothetical protein
VSTRKEIGNAPNFSWFDRLFAVVWVKLPLIWASPATIGSFVVGAEITRSSSTIPNRFRGWFLSIAASRVVTLANFSVPAPVNFSCTCHCPVTLPRESVVRPASAEAMSVPSSSAGPRMYFSVPSTLQVTRGFFGSACSPPCRLASFEQSSAMNFSYRAWSIQAVSLASVGLVGVVAPAGVGVTEAFGLPVGEAGPVPVGVAVGVGVAAFGSASASRTAAGTAIPFELGDGEPTAADGFPLGVTVTLGLAVPLGVGLVPGEPVVDGVGVVVGVGPPASANSTGRNSSCAACLTRSRVFSSGLPGRETTMFWPPWVVTSASETPLPFTRCRMISTARAMLFASTWPEVPGRGCGFRTISTPPSRSSASLGDHSAVPQMVPAAMEPNSAANKSSSATSERTGREWAELATGGSLFVVGRRPASGWPGRGCQSLAGELADGGPSSSPTGAGSASVGTTTTLRIAARFQRRCCPGAVSRTTISSSSSTTVAYSPEVVWTSCPGASPA